MSNQTCSECGTTENVNPAREYPTLQALLEEWNSLETSGGDLLCPECAETISEELRAGTARICRLDPSRPSHMEGGM